MKERRKHLPPQRTRKQREDASTGLTYKSPLEGGYARSLFSK
ncbi:hypothetical protein [Rickettsia japonica]|nr:hypothetical protein [Rickettsia japonica]